MNSMHDPEEAPGTEDFKKKKLLYQVNIYSYHIDIFVGLCVVVFLGPWLLNFTNLVL